MRRVVCPGSFDPITNGHLDIIARACTLFDEVIIAVLVNQTKSSLFTVEERIEMISEVTSRYKNCLLYTSPSPRDLSTSRMPSSA